MNPDEFLYFLHGRLGEKYDIKMEISKSPDSITKINVYFYIKDTIRTKFVLVIDDRVNLAEVDEHYNFTDHYLTPGEIMGLNLDM